MAKFALAGIGLFLALAGNAVAQERTVPQVLIVQAMLPTKEDSDPNVPIANFLAQEIEEAGRMSPIVWSLTDPVFRKANLDGKLKSMPDKPKEADIMSAAKALGADFVIVCQASRVGGNVKATGRLLRGGREIWKDSDSLRVESADGYDSSGTAQSIARTFLLKMNPSIKDLPVKTKIVTPPPAQGQAPEPPPVETPPPPTKTDNTKLKADIQGLILAKQYSQAVSMVRDAVDVDPLDAERRSILIDLLRQTDAAAAAAEASRAGDLLPDKPEFRILEARAWMQAGKSKEAQEALNEAVARAPEATTTRLLLAELAVVQGDPEKALPHLDQTIKNDPNGDAFFLRALCRALLGGGDGAKLDLAEMTKKEPKASPLDAQRRYAMAIAALDKSLTKSEDSTRTLISRAIVKPKDAEVRDAVAETQRLLGARVAFLAVLPHPAESQKAYDRWLLAHRLLTQSLLDLQNFMAGDSDALTDARLNLGEAIKQATTAREDPGK